MLHSSSMRQRSVAESIRTVVALCFESTIFISLRTVSNQVEGHAQDLAAVNFHGKSREFMSVSVYGHFW